MVYRSLALAGLISAASPAMAQDVAMTCTFDVICFETEACEDSGHSLDVTIAAGQPPFAVSASSETETMSGNALKMENGILIQMTSEIGPVILTVDGTGAARQSVHSKSGAQMINSSGRCEAEQ